MTQTNTQFHVIVCAAIENQQGQIFVARRSPDKKLGGYWEFPGGKLEHGEELEEALKREIKEELSIEVSVEDLLLIKPHMYSHGAVLILFYLCKPVTNSIKLVDHDDFKWLEPNELNSVNLLPANEEIVEILKGRPSHG